MDSIGAKKSEISCNRPGLIIEFSMIFLIFISCLFILIFKITDEHIAIFSIYIILTFSLLMLIYKLIEILKSKIELHEKGIIIIKPLKKTTVYKQDIKSIIWYESINAVGPSPISNKCNIELKNNKNIVLSGKSYEDLYDKLSKIKVQQKIL